MSFTLLTLDVETNCTLFPDAHYLRIKYLLIAYPNCWYDHNMALRVSLYSHTDSTR
jgi:hypothetical protein